MSFKLAFFATQDRQTASAFVLNGFPDCGARLNPYLAWEEIFLVL
jgi:hypothetical protein